MNPFQVLILLSFYIMCCMASSERAATGFKNKEQAVINASSAKTDVATGKPSLTNLNGTNSPVKRNVSPKELMSSLKKACENLRIFAENSNNAKDLTEEILSVDNLAKEIQRIDLGDKCGFTSYSASLRVFLKTCSIIESCPLPRGRPTYEFKLPKVGPPKNDQFQPARISQLYVAAPRAYNPGNLNTIARNSAGYQTTSMNFNLQPSIPAWIPVVRMMRVQAAQRAITNRLRHRMRGSKKKTNQESDAAD